MAHILLTYSSRTPTVDLVKRIMILFAERFGNEMKEKDSGAVIGEDILWADSVLLVRPYDVSCTDIVKAAKESGKFIIVYLDDDLLHIPDLDTTVLRKVISRILKKKNQNALRACLNDCDILWGSNAYLLKRYKKYIRNGRCVRSDVTADISNMKKVSERRNDNPHILFAGAQDHAALLNKYIMPALNRIAPEFPSLRMTCIGVAKSQLKPCKVQIKFIPWMNYEQYRAFIRKENYHIGIAVVEQEDFYKCKYYNKFIEYSLLGAAGIYTDSEPYNLVVKHCENGFLAQSSVDSWVDNITFAIRHPQICEKCVQNAQTLIENEYQADIIVERVNHEMPELSMSYGQKSGRIRFRRRTLWYMLRNKGMAIVDRCEKGSKGVRRK